MTLPEPAWHLGVQMTMCVSEVSQLGIHTGIPDHMIMVRPAMTSTALTFVTTVAGTLNGSQLNEAWLKGCKVCN